jgi:predicted  nucleic acid-binding Zn-ribbon protein
MSSRLVDSHKIDYLNMRPTIENIDKQISNNSIKIMNMKTDFVRLKKLVAKIENRKSKKQDAQ